MLKGTLWKGQILFKVLVDFGPWCFMLWRVRKARHAFAPEDFGQQGKIFGCTVEDSTVTLENNTQAKSVSGGELRTTARRALYKLFTLLQI
ncbi:hypothetical protein VTJ04DRAFT_4211 [Mycothermus thermophilus]|uniref:uncharacterized protein n=1 Tax=Humicola insolens TaxID=85995 RepID=UPI003742A1EB